MPAPNSDTVLYQSFWRRGPPCRAVGCREQDEQVCRAREEQRPLIARKGKGREGLLVANGTARHHAAKGWGGKGPRGAGRAGMYCRCTAKSHPNMLVLASFALCMHPFPPLPAPSPHSPPLRSPPLSAPNPGRGSPLFTARPEEAETFRAQIRIVRPLFAWLCLRPNAPRLQGQEMSSFG